MSVAMATSTGGTAGLLQNAVCGIFPVDDRSDDSVERQERICLRSDWSVITHPCRGEVEVC